MVGRIIETPEDVAEGAAHLAALDPRFARALELTGPLPLRRRPDGFETLLSAIVSQQVSTASADAIWNRLAAAGATEPARLAAATDEELRACGLSRQKIAYGRAIATGGLDFARLRTMPDVEVVAELTRLKGIGVWTAEIYVGDAGEQRVQGAVADHRPAKRHAGSPQALAAALDQLLHAGVA
jgi:DNA-3-methyladenine glycosylase II